MWIIGREAVAANEDLGKDLEHVEVHVMPIQCIAISEYFTVYLEYNNYTL